MRTAGRRVEGGARLRYLGPAATTCVKTVAPLQSGGQVTLGKFCFCVNIHTVIRYRPRYKKTASRHKPANSRALQLGSRHIGLPPNRACRTMASSSKRWIHRLGQISRCLCSGRLRLTMRRRDLRKRQAMEVHYQVPSAVPSRAFMASLLMTLTGVATELAKSP